MSRAPLPTTDPAAPCDDCQHRDRCASSAETCESFTGYVSGNPRWRKMQRLPRRRDERLADALIGEAAIALDE